MVHFLGVDDVTVLLLAQVGGVDAIGAQELPVGNTEGLADGLCDELRLRGKSSVTRGNYSNLEFYFIHLSYFVHFFDYSIFNQCKGYEDYIPGADLYSSCDSMDRMLPGTRGHFISLCLFPNVNLKTLSNDF